MRWSVGSRPRATGCWPRSEIVELADAVAASDGIATGIGTNRYGARSSSAPPAVRRPSRRATAEFVRPRPPAGLPAWPIVRVEAVSEDEDPVDGG